MGNNERTVPALVDTGSDVIGQTSLGGTARLEHRHLLYLAYYQRATDYHGKRRHHMRLMYPAECRKSTHQNSHPHNATDQSADLGRRLDGLMQASNVGL